MSDQNPNVVKSVSHSWQRRTAALLEVLGVFVIGTLAARFAGRLLDIGPASLRSLEPGVQPDFFSLSQSAAANLVLRYGLVLGLAFAIGWWHRRRRVASYGVTTAGLPLTKHLGIAALLFAAGGILPLLVRMLPDFIPMGRSPEHWQFIESLRTPGIWAYLFVGSFGLVPIAEELFARGYVQTRLTEDFGPAAAILITAVFFTFSHTQYFIASAVGIGMILSLLIGSLAAGYVRYRTGSLLPVIIAHALGNLPFRGWVAAVVLGVMVVTIIAYGRVIFRYAVDLWREVITRRALVAAVFGVVAFAALLVQVLFAPRLLPFSATAALAVALLLELREKRSARA